MDNFSAHKMINEHTKNLTHKCAFQGFQYLDVFMIFLPPNITSTIQPLDQGIIAAFKTAYYRQHVAYNLQEVNNGIAQKDANVNMLQVLQWMREAGHHIEGETISNCSALRQIFYPFSTRTRRRQLEVDSSSRIMTALPTILLKSSSPRCPPPVKSSQLAWKWSRMLRENFPMNIFSKHPRPNRGHNIRQRKRRRSRPSRQQSRQQSRR